MSRDLATLADMLLAGRTIQDLVSGMDEGSFVDDVRTRSAVAYQLGIVGEGVRRLSREFREGHAEIPWLRISGMRNWLMHQYDAVDWERVWGAIQDDLPGLMAALERAIPPESLS